ncbi:MAG: efflux RND transporter periplasmic adaptor subunit [Bacteroidota bacterium]|nr:efflux RND transporter periplasmic adaptor subunit [Bacteroidota bacterium]
MKKMRIVWIVILIAAAATGIWYFKFHRKEKPVVLDTEKPAYGYIAMSVTATGTVQPVDTVSVGTQVSGTIKYVYADFNSRVKKGQLVAELDKSLLNAQVNQFQANLQVAKSQLIYQESTYNRQNLLYQAGAISKADYETAMYLYNTAKANVQSVQAQLDAALKNLSYANIYSPVDGVVMLRNVNIGQTVASSFSTPTLFIIAKDISKMQVQAAVDEADIGNVKQNQRATFTVDAFPESLFSGTVEQIRLEPTISANVVTYSTIIKAPNDDLQLKPGMTANIVIYTKEENNALLISARALKFKPDPSLDKQFKIGALNMDSAGGLNGSRRKKGTGVRRPDSISKKTNDTTVVITPQKAFVWVKENDSLVQKKISIGLNDDTHVQVLRGLTTDDEVVDAIQNPLLEPQASSAPAKSPFMPQRRGSASPKKPPQPK